MGFRFTIAVAGMKHSLSRQHLRGARLFAAEAAAIEARSDPTSDDEDRLRSYAIGAVTSSVAFLEASINELYLEAVDRSQDSLAGVSEPQKAVLAELWNSVEQHQLLGKYQIALAVCQRKQFEKGTEPYQGADALVKLRNALIHYRPEWDYELDEHKKLKDRLLGRFAACVFAKPGSLWFPHFCLGAGCAGWAVNQAEQFMAEFCRRLQIPNRLP